MADNKKSFLLYNDLIHTVKLLKPEQQGNLFLSILEFVNGNEKAIDDPLVKIAFEPIKQTLLRDIEKYGKIVERNRINGKKGGRPTKPKKPNGLNGNPVKTQKPKKADSDSDSDSDSENVNESEKPNKSSLVDNICNYFSITENAKPDVVKFIENLEKEKSISGFINQSKAYKELKMLSGQNKHSWNTFKNEWKNTDWINKLNEFRKNKKSSEEKKQSEVDQWYSKYPDQKQQRQDAERFHKKLKRIN